MQERNLTAATRWREWARPIGMMAMVVVLGLLSTVGAAAQGTGDSLEGIILPRLNPVDVGLLGSRGPGVNSQQPPRSSRQRSLRRKVLGGIVGGVGGFFGGLFLGAAIEGDRCNCDDPGLVGALIGAPVGAAAGGILGYKFLF